MREYASTGTSNGAPPGRSLHKTPDRTRTPRIRIFDYNEAQFTESQVESVSECRPPSDKSTIRWINVDGVHMPEIITKIGEAFGLHPLTIEDIFTPDQQPKVEALPEYALITMRMIRNEGQNGPVVSEQVSILLGSNYVLSFQEVEGDVFDPIRRRIREEGSRVRKSGADYLAYSLMDLIVDNYFVLLNQISENIEMSQERIILEPTADTLRDIYELKRAMAEMRRYTWPVREIALRLERESPQMFKKSTLPYLRDLYDHVIQITDHIEIYREWLGSMLDIYLSSVTNRLNEVIKVLTVISTIAIPPTVVGSWYGMNLLIPEFDSDLAYPIVIMITLTMMVIMLTFFKRKRWI
ncbi:MAG: magnesium/cobalt transporter CorA [Candidatus Thorarchaeota archaeon]|nr:magnesium/cobalt transporter CorA [Candidatus Thorarchaeota archaeon]